MIPQIIHYCWFGGNPLPNSARKYIESWRKHFPGYEIKEWNEKNFDVNSIAYTRDAYKAGKYAFVSDYARFWILYHHGGVYFDTDVEVIRRMDDIIAKGAFMGFELDNVKSEKKVLSINPGVGLGAEKGNPIYAEILQGFEKLDYYLPDGTRNPFTMIPMVTRMMQDRGLVLKDEMQTIDSITIYPNEYFNPFDDITGVLRKTANTRSIHWYAKTWIEASNPRMVSVKRLLRRVLGTGFVGNVKRLLKHE